MKTLTEFLLEIKIKNKETASKGGLKSSQRKAEKSMLLLNKKKRDGSITKTEYSRLKSMISRWYDYDIESYDEYKQKYESLTEAATGDCYQAAGRFLMDQAMAGKSAGYKLIHGEVTGQAHLEGIKYGHAWIEKGNTVYDYSNGRDIEMPKEVYYALGKIKKSKNTEYTSDEMMSKLAKAHHWGPW